MYIDIADKYNYIYIYIYIYRYVYVYRYLYVYRYVYIYIIKQSQWILLVLRKEHVLTLIIKHDKDLKFEVGDHVRIPKYKNIFAKKATGHIS